MFKDFIQSFQPKTKFIELYNEILKDVFRSTGTDRELSKLKLKDDIQIINDRLNNAIIKNLDGKLTDCLFEQISKKLTNEKTELETRLKTLSNTAPEFAEYLKNSTTLLSDLGNFYVTTDTESKKQLIGSIFPEKIYFENNEYRTNKINDVVALMCSGSKGLKENNLASLARLSTNAPTAGLEPATL